MAETEPVRVLFVLTSSGIGGAEMIVQNVIMRLDRERFSPILCSLCPAGRVASELAIHGVPVVSLDMSEEAGPIELVRGAVRLASVMDEYAVDLVHSFLYRANVLSRIAGRLCRRHPLVYSGHHTLVPNRGRRAEMMARLTQPLGHGAIVVSGPVRDYVSRTERVPSEKIVVIRNGVDTERFRPAASSGGRKKAGEAVRTRLGSVGRLVPIKEQTMLLRALADLRDRNVPFSFELVGDGPERGALERERSRLQLDECVSFLGERAGVEEFYPNLDAFVLSSRQEAAPTVVLEAMACGVPVVATAVGGVLEMVENERTGLVVPPSDSDALALALERLCKAPDLRARFALAARERAVEHFSVEAMVKAHEQFYAAAIAGSD